MSVDAYARALERAVSQSQQVLARTIEPETGIFERHAIEALLEILANRHLVATMREHGATRRRVPLPDRVTRILEGREDLLRPVSQPV